jgi:hypothetical protein
MLALFTLLTFANAAPEESRDADNKRPEPAAVVEKTIAVEVMTPDGAWEIKIEEIRQVQQELWVFARVVRPEGAIAAMMHSAASDQISGRFPDLPLKVFVVGKTWTWANEEPVEWLANSSALAEKRRQGKRLWRR